MSASDNVSSQSLAREGFAVIPNALSGGQCDILVGRCDVMPNNGAGSRNLLEQDWCVDLARQIRTRLHDLLPQDAVTVQCTYFDKSLEKNWLVALHQDLSIPVKHRVESAECSGWSEKEGVIYVQPPMSVLEQLVAMRIHLDECRAENGALRVVPRSHLEGRLDREQTESLRLRYGETVLPVDRGGALLMKPLILHASSKSSSQAPRRVLHFVYGPKRLPLGLEWNWQV